MNYDETSLITGIWPRISSNRHGRTARRLLNQTAAGRLRLCLVLALLSLSWFSYNVLFAIHDQNGQKGSIFLEKIKGNVHFHYESKDAVKRSDNRNALGSTFSPPTRHHHHANPRFRTSFELSLLPTGGNEPPGVVPVSQKKVEKLLLGIELYPPDKLISGLGENGEPAHLPASLRRESVKHFAENSFDSVLSDRISLNRHLKDYRGEM